MDCNEITRIIKAQSISEIEDKIEYLKANQKCIEILRLLEY